MPKFHNKWAGARKRLPLKSTSWLCLGCEVAQHVLQDAAVLEVLQLVQRIDTAEQRHFLHLTVGIGDLGGHRRARLDGLDAINLDRLVTLEAELCPACLLGEDKRHNAHSNQVGAVDAFERLRDHSANTEQVGALCSPVA